MTSILSSLCCYGRRQRAPSDAAPAAPAAALSRPGVLARLSGLATAARSSAQLGLAIGAAVTCCLTTKASYIAAMMAAGSTANKAVSTGIVLGSTVVVQSGVRTLVEGVRCLARERPALTPGFVRSMKVLGVAAYLTAMLGSAYRAMQEEETQPLGAYMLSHAAGQVLSVLVAEWVANQLVPHVIVPIELLDDTGALMGPASPKARALRPTAEMALIAGQIVAHVALMAWMLDKIPLVQRALGTPAGFRPGQDSPEDHLRAGLGVALMIGGSEVGRVAMGGVGMALMQTLKGATLRRAQPQVENVDVLVVDPIEMQAPAIGADRAPAVSRWEQASQALDQAGHRIGLGADARGRLASYAPILNLTVDALTTGPHSGLIRGLARSLDKPLFDVAIGVSNFTMSLLNAADMLLLARQTRPAGGAPVPDEPVSNYGSVSESPPLHREPSANSSTEDSELNQVVMYYAGKPSPTRHAPVASHDSQTS
jgi:hypothetical protein